MELTIKLDDYRRQSFIRSFVSILVMLQIEPLVYAALKNRREKIGAPT